MEQQKPKGMTCPCCQQWVEGVDFLMDPESQTLTNGSASVKLTRQEWKLAKFLLDRYPLAADKDEIYSAVFMDERGEGPEMKIIDVVVCRIRPNLAEVGLALETLWGIGYKLSFADAETATEIKNKSPLLRRPGSYHRWTDEYERRLGALMGQSYTPTQCAAIMKLPFMTVERHYKRIAAAMQRQVAL